jgi:hypothetical protein
MGMSCNPQKPQLSLLSFHKRKRMGTGYSPLFDNNAGFSEETDVFSGNQRLLCDIYRKMFCRCQLERRNVSVSESILDRS